MPRTMNPKAKRLDAAPSQAAVPVQLDFQLNIKGKGIAVSRRDILKVIAIGAALLTAAWRFLN